MKLVEKLLYKENKIEVLSPPAWAGGGGKGGGEGRGREPEREERERHRAACVTQVKESGFQLLLHMCEAMGTPETNMLELIPAAVNLNAFGIDYAGEIHRGAWNRVTEGMLPSPSETSSTSATHPTHSSTREKRRARSRRRGKARRQCGSPQHSIRFHEHATVRPSVRLLASGTAPVLSFHSAPSLSLSLSRAHTPAPLLFPGSRYEQFKNLFLYIFYPSLHPQAQPASRSSSPPLNDRTEVAHMHTHAHINRNDAIRKR